MTVQRFRKKPVVIEAMRCTRETAEQVAAWCGGRVEESVNQADKNDVYVAVLIPTLEGVMTANATIDGGDWVIRGVRGEFYPCKPDIFAQTYEATE